MEEMTRLALVEQSFLDGDVFSKVLRALLRHINNILEHPQDYEIRSIASDFLNKCLQQKAFVDYLKSIGFRKINEEYTYPKDRSLSPLQVARVAIERKMYYCSGLSLESSSSNHRNGLGYTQKLVAQNVLDTTNPFLLKVERLFNDVLKYEDPDLQEAALSVVPLTNLRLRALRRMRAHQKKIKTGEIDEQDIPYEIALLMELMGWFKYQFFSWVDRPPCAVCDGPTVLERTSARRIENEICNVEMYRCTKCPRGSAEFVRHNDVRTLLRTRRGRCGEWANCFALLCRALGYDTRYVYDTTDHVWCEIYDHTTNSWLHADPCETQLDAPLLYSKGWGKTLSYVIAASRDDLQDVTWRYTTDHKEVLSRRSECSESALIAAILALRAERQRQLTPARKNALARRALVELVKLMVPRTVSSSECRGRISGAEEWRRERGELAAAHSHQFTLRPGRHWLHYYTAADSYRIVSEEDEAKIDTWLAGAHNVSDVFRKVEEDWQMVYLARTEGASVGTISWRISAADNARIASMRVRALTQTYEDGKVVWTVQRGELAPVDLDVAADSDVETPMQCARATLTCALRGGRGSCAWQHAQLGRQARTDAQPAITIAVVIEDVEKEIGPKVE